MKRYDVVLDAEADGLDDATTIWMVVAKVIGEERWLVARTPEELRKAIPYFNKVVVHNGLGYDLPTIRRLWGIPYTVEPDTWDGHAVEFLDSFHVSSYLNPDYPGGHSLDNLSRGSAQEKMNFRQACIEDGIIESSAPEGAEFKQDSELMLEYCRRDCLALEGVYHKLMKSAKEKYGHS